MLASQQILEAAAAALVAGATAAGSNVNRKNRALPFNTFPGLRVYLGDEDLGDGEDITWPRVEEHQLDLVVEAVTREADDIEAALNALVLQVLQVLQGTQAGSQLSPLQGVRLVTRRIARRVATEGEHATGTAQIRFAVVFATDSDDPETLLT